MKITGHKERGEMVRYEAKEIYTGIYFLCLISHHFPSFLMSCYLHLPSASRFIYPPDRPVTSMNSLLPSFQLAGCFSFHLSSKQRNRLTAAAIITAPALIFWISSFVNQLLNRCCSI